jgi:hypothetical protein
MQELTELEGTRWNMCDESLESTLKLNLLTS